MMNSGFIFIPSARLQFKLLQTSLYPARIVLLDLMQVWTTGVSVEGVKSELKVWSNV